MRESLDLVTLDGVHVEVTQVEDIATTHVFVPRRRWINIRVGTGSAILPRENVVYIAQQAVDAIPEL